jgi:superfamily II DNA or RNA helicase
MNFIDVGITNRRAFFLSPDYPEKALLEYYSYTHPQWKYIERVRPGWDGLVSFLKNDEVPAGLFWATKKEIEEKLGINFRIKSRLEWPGFKTSNLLGSDRVFQNECRDAMIKASRFGGGLVINATRSGKTRIAAMLFSCLKGPVCFIVDQLILMEQAKSDLQNDLNEEIGWVGDSDFEPKRVTVATRQTMFLHQNRREFKDWTRELEVVVIDEIHAQMNKSNFSVIERIEPKAVFGLTATLQLNKKHIRTKAYAIAGPIVYTYPLLRGQEEGILAKGISVSVGYQNEIQKGEMYSRFFNRRWRKWEMKSKWKELYDKYIVDNDERNFLIESLVRKNYIRDKYTIVLVTRLRHLKQLSDRFSDIPHRVVSGTFEGKSIKVKDRMKFKDKFEEGKVRLILANVVFSKGITIKRVDVVIDASAGKNPDDALQKYGRGIGLHENKVGLLHFDISDYDTQNEKNYFSRSAKSRRKALQDAGVEVHKLRWQDETDTEGIVDRAERWLDQTGK